MATQTITLPASGFTRTFSLVRWQYTTGRPQINSDLLAPNTTAYVQFIDFSTDGTNGDVILRLSPASSGALGGADDFSDQFEASGTITITAAGNTLTVAIGGADTSEPYEWTPSNSTEVDAFIDAFDQSPGTVSATLVLNDNAPIDHAVDAGDVTHTWSIPQPTVTKTRVATDHAVNAGNVTHTWQIPEPAVTFITPTDHAVNAGDVTHTWQIPEPEVTHTTATGTDYSVNAGDVTHTWSIPEPTITLTGVGPQSYTVNAGDVTHVWVIPQPSFTVRRARVVGPSHIVWLLDVNHGQYRWASDEFDVIWSGQTFNSLGKLLQIQLPGHAMGETRFSASLRIAVPPDDTLLNELVVGLNAVPVTIYQVFGEVSGAPMWTATDYSFSGILSRSTIVEGAWVAEIRRERLNDQSLMATWTHEAQYAEYPGDRGLEQMASLERGVKLRWPPG